MAPKNVSYMPDYESPDSFRIVGDESASDQMYDAEPVTYEQDLPPRVIIPRWVEVLVGFGSMLTAVETLHGKIAYALFFFGACLMVHGTFRLR